MSAQEELYAFERGADGLVAKLDLWRKPLRSILSSLFLTADAEFSGGRFGRYRTANPEKGATILSRTSYLIPFLAESDAAIGQDLQNALEVLDVNDFADISSALTYAHFCELMPFVRNGYLGVERSGNGFRLRHPSAIFAYDEQRDIIATELSLTSMEQQFPFQTASLSRMVEGWPQVRSDDLLDVLHGAYVFYLDGVNEDEFVDALAYQRAFGFERADLVRVRAALMALGSWCIGMAAAADAESLRAKAGQEDKWRCECMEWVVPLLRANFVVGIVQSVSSVSFDHVDSILSYFLEEPLDRRRDVSGDGYLAPIVRLGSSLLFSPRALLTMLAERNLLYVLNKTDRVHFDELVSDQLEPALLGHAEKALGQIAGLRVRRNVVWEGGEIDLLVYDPASNTALQVQAKAPIPPQGARMTRQVESNTLRAVEQLENFEGQPPSAKDGLLARSFSLSCKDVRWASAVLTRSSFGTSRAWSAIMGKAALNLPLLRQSLRDLEHDGAVDMTRLPEAAARILSGVIQASSNGWTNEKIGTSIEFPNLDLDYRALGQAKRG
jgi:hypothetical protein